MKKLSQVSGTTGLRVRQGFILLFLSMGLIVTAVAFRSPVGAIRSPAGGNSRANPLLGLVTLHFQGNTEDPPQGAGTANCTGVGVNDLTICDGPFLTDSAVLSASGAARWSPNSTLGGANNRSIHDDSWVWRPSVPTQISGTITIEWWAEVNATAALTGMEWRIKLSNVIGGPTNNTTPPTLSAGEFYHAFHSGPAVTPTAVGVPQKLSVTLVGIPLTDVTAGMVLVIEPRFSDTGAGSHIYYDSTGLCSPTATSGPCDSTITVDVLGSGSPTPTPSPTPSPSPPPPSSCAAATYDNYQPPVNTPGTATPYPRRDGAGEPSIGVNWNTGNVMTMPRFSPSRTTFDDSTSPANPAENTGHKWFSRSIQTLAVGADPILFTDSVTGRTIAGELQIALGATNGIISDDDLATVITTVQTGGITQGFDHQTIGGGPSNPNAPSNRQPIGPYPHMMYYASQQIAYGGVATSFDGGVTYEPAVPAYTLADCGGIHGHINVAPDGTVYIPNKNCGGKAAVSVSEDNGLNWDVRQVPTSSSIGGISDPGIGIGAGGKLYMSYTSATREIRVAVSDDRGLTWHDDVNLSTLITPVAITGGLFPAVVAGDNDRAAVFFLGTTSTDPGDEFGSDPTVKATWFPYIATTCDGGRTWSVVRADNDPLFPGVPNPLQQGPVCTSGTTCPAGPPNTRNLLDFNGITVDARGRILATYADGCNFGHPCINIIDNSGDSNSNQAIARLTIIRQRGGMRLFSAFDPGGPAAPTLSPPVNIESEKYGNKVKWAEPDDGGSPLTAYRIYRGLTGGIEQMIAEVKPGLYVYRDRLEKPGSADYYYRVTAVNAYGESPRNVKSLPGQSVVQSKAE